MVALEEAEASNARIAKELPARMVAVFVGATNGIGENTLRMFAKTARDPRVYIIGRVQEAADRIIADCKKDCPGGEFTFIKADISAIKTVDQVCRDIRAKETAINLLFMTQGTLAFDKRSPDDLLLALALVVHSRGRFIANLLPLLKAATGLRRVVSVFAGTKDGPIDKDKLDCEKLSLTKGRGHLTSMVTLLMESYARQAPTVSFVHTFPGPVKGGLGRSMEGFVMGILKVAFDLAGPFIFAKPTTCGAYNVYAATSAAFSPREDQSTGGGVPLQSGRRVAVGSNGQEGSGMYLLDQVDEPGSNKVVEVLAQLRSEGLSQAVWDHVEGDFKRITGSVSI